MTRALGMSALAMSRAISESIGGSPPPETPPPVLNRKARRALASYARKNKNKKATR